MAGAATIYPGNDKASEYTVEAARTLSQASTLTVDPTNAIQGFYLIVCRAPALGYVLTIANGGPLGGNIASFNNYLAVPRGAVLYFDGTNFSLDGYCWIAA